MEYFILDHSLIQGKYVPIFEKAVVYSEVGVNYSAIWDLP
jgi:hypothetical protein